MLRNLRDDLTVQDQLKECEDDAHNDGMTAAYRKVEEMLKARAKWHRNRLWEDGAGEDDLLRAKVQRMRRAVK